MNAYEELQTYRCTDECRQKKTELMMEEMCYHRQELVNISSTINTSANSPSFRGVGMVLAIDAFAAITMREAATLLYQPSPSDDDYYKTV